MQDIKDAAKITNTQKHELAELKIESVMIVFCSLNRMNHVRLICSFFFLNVTGWFGSQRIFSLTGLVSFYLCHSARGLFNYERNSNSFIFKNDLNGNQGMSLLGPNLKDMVCMSTSIFSHLYGYVCCFNGLFSLSANGHGIHSTTMVLTILCFYH